MKLIKSGLLAFVLVTICSTMSLADPDAARPLINRSNDIGFGYTNTCPSLRNNGGTCYWYAAAGSGTVDSGLFTISRRTRVCQDTLSGGSNAGSIQVHQMIGPYNAGLPFYFTTPTSATLDGTDCLFLHSGSYWMTATQGAARIAVQLQEVMD